MKYIIALVAIIALFPGYALAQEPDVPPGHHRTRPHVCIEFVNAPGPPLLSHPDTCRVIVV